MKRKEATNENIAPIPEVVYNRIFGRDRDGAAILAELNRIYYNRPSYRAGESERDMAFREGQRAVVAHLNLKTNREG